MGHDGTHHRRESSPHWEIAILLVAGGLAVTLAIVFALTRIVLKPIEELQESIVAFGAGERPRAPH